MYLTYYRGEYLSRIILQPESSNNKLTRLPDYISEFFIPPSPTTSYVSALTPKQAKVSTRHGRRGYARC